MAKHEIAQAHAGLGSIYYAQKDVTKALAEAIAFNQLKFVPKLENMAALMHLRPGNFGDDQLKLDGQHKEKELLEHVLLADMLLESRCFDEAIQEYDKAIALNPDDGDLHSYLLNVCVESGKWAEALREDFSVSKTVVSKIPEEVGKMLKAKAGDK